MLSILLAAALTQSASREAGPGFEAAVAAYEAAQLHGDGAMLRRILADDYMLVTSNGTRENKQEFIADLTDPSFKLEPYVIQAPLVRTWRAGAVVAGIARQKGVAGAKSFDACIRYADTWKFDAGRWQVILTQVTRAEPPGPGGCKAP